MHADEMIERLSLRPHPEGGFFRETFRHQPMDGQRGALTVIYYLLRSGERSAWHRVDAIEVWHYYDGAPIRLSISDDGVTVSSLTLSTDFASGHEPQAVVPANAWQTEKASVPGLWWAAQLRQLSSSQASSLRHLTGRRVKIDRSHQDPTCLIKERYQ